MVECRPLTDSDKEDEVRLEEQRTLVDTTDDEPGEWVALGLSCPG